MNRHRRDPVRFVALVLAGALWLGLTPPAIAADRVWSAVIVASQVDAPKPPPAELRSVAPRLKRVFGANQFEVIGSEIAELDDGTERALRPTQNFWMQIKARRASVKEARGGYLLNLQLYQGKQTLVDTVAMLAPDSPLFFRGPMSARGQVIVVLLVSH
jgi:hypothetical protein